MDSTPAIPPEVLLRHREFALRLARQLLRDSSAAEDVAQEALIATWKDPPRHGSVRAWLARVVKHRASDRRRGEARRENRERATARQERVETVPGPEEQLETQHGVVAAVLALDEPYRAVVIATYYQGLTPKQIGDRDGIPASTVRTHLHRAHGMLQRRLANDHDGDANGHRALLAFVRSGDEAASAPNGTRRDSSLEDPIGRATSSAASGGPSTWAPLSLAIGAVCALTAWSTWYVSQSPSATSIPLAGDVRAVEDPAPTTIEAERVASGSRVAVVGEVAPALDEIDAMDLDALVARSRALKAAIANRRLALSPEDEDRRFANRPDAGIVKLVDRSETRGMLDYAGARGGGAEYSFVRRTHDGDRDPQIAFEDGLLRAHETDTSAWILDLGPCDLFEVLAAMPQSPFPADRLRTVVWETMTSSFHASMKGDMNWDMLGAEFEQRVGRALQEGTLVPADVDPRSTPTVWTSARAESGHTYLLRSMDHRRFDVAVLLSVARLGGGECTLRWLRLAGYPNDRVKDAESTDESGASLPELPASVSRLSPDEWAAQLERVRARAEAILFTRFSAVTEARYGSWRGRDDAGLTRLLRAGSAWGELSRDPVTGASQFSFLHGRHAAVTNDLCADMAVIGTPLPSLRSAGAEGYVIDLGEVPLETLTVSSTGSANPEAVSFVRDFDFEVEARRRLAAASRLGTIGDTSRPVPADAPVWSDVFRTYHRHLWDLMGVRGTAAVVGHTYLVRAFTPARSDVLAAFTVAEGDGHGVVIAWRRWRATDLSRAR